MKILVTGAAGFVGSHTSTRLLSAGHELVCVDNFNSYYDPALKRARIASWQRGVEWHEGDIAESNFVAHIFSSHTFDQVLHLAAQAGVRHSIAHPLAYASANSVGTQVIFEHAHLAGNVPVTYASSSSVYGDAAPVPFSEDTRCDEPVSVYAATKRGNELLAHVYASMYGMRMTGLRFFTVYGPWGRPDMAYFSFTKKVLAGEVISLYNQGDMQRDFTCVDDIVAGVVSAMAKAPPGYRIYNLGRGEPVTLKEFVESIEVATKKQAVTELLPMQPGDVHRTFADIKRARTELGYDPQVSIRDGVQRFVEWYRAYYNV